MDRFFDPNHDELTSTLNVTSLRPVPTEGSIAEKLTSQEREIIANLEPGTAMFIILAGPGKGSRFLINAAKTTIGRDPKADIFLDDITVSRSHASVENSKELMVVDSNSLNGTYLNSNLIKKSSLKTGDELQVGKFRLTCFLSGKDRGR